MPLLWLVVPRAVPAFVWRWHGVSFSRERGCAVAIGVALSCLLIALQLLLRGVEVCCGTSSCEARWVCWPV